MFCSNEIEMQNAMHIDVDYGLRAHIKIIEPGSNKYPKIEIIVMKKGSP